MQNKNRNFVIFFCSFVYVIYYYVIVVNDFCNNNVHNYMKYDVHVK